MYHATVREIKWSRWRGIKHVHVLDESARYPEELIAKISRYQNDDRYQVIFHDLTDYYGTYDDREVNDETAWDFYGEPVKDEREKEAMKDAERAARYYDEFGDELPF